MSHGSLDVRGESDPQPISILNALQKFRTVIVIHTSQEDLSTQIPLVLHAHGGYGKLVLAQSRRAAAISAAHRVAMKLGGSEDVGYSVQFESKIGSKTTIKYTTDCNVPGNHA